MGLAEKYRPKSINEVLGQDHIKPIMKEYVKRREIPHMLFIGPPGCGKTSMAYALCNELNWAIVELNASDERGIDVVRSKIKKLALSAGKRIILLDEADSMTEDAQHALRRIMEKAGEKTSVRFILTCNDEWRIIEPIKSRCAIFRFKKLPENMVLKRLIEILKQEGVKFSKNDLPKVKEALQIIVDVSQGDMRKALNLLETVISSRKAVTVENVKSLVSPDLALEAFKYSLNGDFEKAVKTLEDLIISNKLDAVSTVNQFYKAIVSLNDLEFKSKLLIELARAEHAIKLGGSPLIQLSAVLATAWVLSRSKRGR